MGNSFIHPEKVSIKTWTYLYLPLANQIMGKSVSQHFPKYWLLTWSPFWLKALCFGFIWAQTWHLAETSCTRFSSLGITYLHMNNEEIVLDPIIVAWRKSVTRVLPFFFLGELIFPMMSSTHLWLQAVDSFLLHFLFFLGCTTGSSGIWYVTKI